MSGEIEYGKCDICGEMNELNTKYYFYDIVCECHSPQHFEVINHCNYCEPEEPEYTKVMVKTKNYKTPTMTEQDIIKEFLSEIEKNYPHDNIDYNYKKKLIESYLLFKRNLY